MDLTVGQNQEWSNGQTGGRTDGPTDGRTNERADGRTDRGTDGRANGRTDGGIGTHSKGNPRTTESRERRHRTITLLIATILFPRPRATFSLAVLSSSVSHLNRISAFRRAADVSDG